MAIDVAELVPSLMREINAPGEVAVEIDESQWVGYLTDAFWEARLNGLLTGYTEDGGLIQPTAGSEDLSRDLQQLIVLYAGFRITLTTYRNMNSVYRTKAGPVEYEVQKSAAVLKALLDTLRARITFFLERLNENNGTSVAAFDAVVESSYAVAAGESTSWYVGG